jgi:acyl-CoA thioesterase FadM
MKFSNELANLVEKSSEVSQFAHSEGNNVMSWIGFKHIMYLAEQAVLSHFRSSDMGFRRLFEEHGLLLEVVANQGRILHALKLDEEVQTVVKPAVAVTKGLQFDIAMFVQRADKRIKTYSGKIRIVLVADRALRMAALQTDYGALTPYVTERVSCVADNVDTTDPASKRLNWTVTIPYFYCHGNERLKMSGYLRYMEEADERFCEQHNIGVNKLLQERRWIPAVPSAKVQILEAAYMRETLHIEYAVKDVIKSLLYTCSMNAYVERDGSRIHVATGEIVHGYAEILSRKDWAMVNFDREMIDALGA